MAILGNNTKGSTGAPTTTGTKHLSKFTLASAQTLTELHGWFAGGAGAPSIILCIYTDVAGVPTTRVAFTSPITLPSSGDVDMSQTGFSVALAAGDYWIGCTGSGSAGAIYEDPTGGTSDRWTTGTTFNPPASPCEGGASAGTRKYSAWAVVGTPAAAFVPQIAIL